jgi:Arc/MetJ family transcription regulator
MTTTVDIPEDVLRRAMIAGGVSSAQEAVLKALDEFVNRHDQRELIRHLGSFEKFMTPDDLDAMRRDE